MAAAHRPPAAAGPCRRLPLPGPEAVPARHGPRRLRGARPRARAGAAGAGGAGPSGSAIRSSLQPRCRTEPPALGPSRTVSPGGVPGRCPRAGGRARAGPAVGGAPHSAPRLPSLRAASQRRGCAGVREPG